MEKKLAQDGRRAEAEILIQEMLDRFRSELEKEYAQKIVGKRAWAMAKGNIHDDIRNIYVESAILLIIHRGEDSDKRRGARGSVATSF